MMLDTESYSRIFDNLHDGLYFVDLDRVIRYWNKAAERISGYSAEEVIGKSCADSVLTHVDGNGVNLCKSLCPLVATMADGEGRQAEVYLHHKEGHRVPVSVRVSTLTDREGNIIGGVELFTDISHLKSIEIKLHELEEMALLDGLTRLANRTFLEREISASFEERKRFGVPFGILFMDIDYFKIFNDTWGHEVGDRVLRFVADTLLNNVRPFDIVGRWGGEEFIAIIRNVNRKQLEQLGNRLRLLVESSYIPHEEESLKVTISIGATLAREDDDMERLLRRADTLLYASKSAGRNRLTMDRGR